MQKRPFHRILFALAPICAFALMTTFSWAQGSSVTTSSPKGISEGNAANMPSMVQLKLNIPKDSQVNPTTVFKVPQHSTVNLEVLSEKSGELHIHAYRLSLTVKEGEKKTLSFLAKASGKFNIEWHPKGPDAPKDGSTQSVTQHESGHGHAPPLASLEVLPL